MFNAKELLDKFITYYNTHRLEINRNDYILKTTGDYVRDLITLIPNNLSNAEIQFIKFNSYQIGNDPLLSEQLASLMKIDKNIQTTVDMGKLLDKFLNYNKSNCFKISKDKYILNSTGNYVFDIITFVPHNLLSYEIQFIKDNSQKTIDEMILHDQLNKLLKIEKIILRQENDILNRSYKINNVTLKFLNNGEILDKNETVIKMCNDPLIVSIIRKKYKTISKYEFDVNKPEIVDTTNSVILCGYAKNIIIYKNILSDKLCIYMPNEQYSGNDIEEISSNLLVLLYSLSISNEWGHEFNTININMPLFGDNNDSAKHILLGLKKTINKNNYVFIKSICFNYVNNDIFYKAFEDIIKK